MDYTKFCSAQGSRADKPRLNFLNLMALLGGVLISLGGGCSARQNAHAVLQQPSAACLHEVKESVRQLSGTEHVRISDTVFQKESLLLLTNLHQRLSPEQNPLSGAVGAQIPLRLFVENGICQIGLLDQGGRIVHKRALQKCSCKAEEAQ